MSLDYTMDRTKAEKGIAIMSLTGAVDNDAALTLEAALDSAFQTDGSSVVVDLSGVRYISSSGWRIFILKMKQFRDHRARLKIAGMRSTVRTVFELLGFAQIIDAYANLEEALAEFEAGDGATSLSS